MKTKTKILKTEQVILDEELYPRNHWDYVTRARYFHAMKSGNVFPAITVAESDGKYILVDGLHRLLATKDIKETHIECEVLTGLTREQIYEEAIKRNVTHGRQFSTQEIVKIAVRLEDLGYETSKISELILIPAGEIKQFVAERITTITETRERVSLKSPLHNLGGLEMSQTVPIEKQSIFNSKSQAQLLDSLITLLENNWIDLQSEIIVEKLEKIYKLLLPLILPLIQTEIETEEPKQSTKIIKLWKGEK